MDLGKFFQDAGRNIGNFFGWNQSEEEKRRKAEEARQKAEQQRQQQQQQKAQQPTGLLTVPTIQTQKTQPTPQQTGNRPTTADPFMLNKPQENKPQQQQKVQPPKADKSEIEQISGYYVMTPQAQAKALDDLRKSGKGNGSKEEQVKAVKESLKSKDDNRIKQTMRLASPDVFKQANDELFAEKKKADEENLKTIGNIPIINTMGQWGAGLASLYGQATNNQDLVKDANNRRDLLTLGMNSEELAKFDPETQDKLRVLQNVVTGLGALDVAGVTSLAKAPIIQGVKQGVKEGIKSEAGKAIIKESAKQTAKQYKNNVIAGTLVGGVADPAIQAYIKDGQVDWSSVPSSMLQGGLWAAALPEFSSKQKLVQKMAKGEALTPEESNTLNKALRDAEGVEVPDFTPEQLKKIEDAKTTMAEQNKNKLPAGVTEDDLPVVSVKRADGRLEMYRPKNADEFRQYERFIDGAHAGKLDSNGDTWHISSGTAVKDGGQYKQLNEAPEINIPDPNSVEGVQRMLAQADEPQQVIDDVQAQAAQQAQGGSSKGISYDDVMATLRERNRVYNEADPQTKAEIDARARQANPDDITTNTPYSREAVYSDLQATGLTPEDITSLTQRYDMTAQDWRAVLNATGDTSKARNIGGLMDSQIRTVLNKQAKTAERPTVDTPQGKVYSDTGEFVDDVPPQGGAPEPEAPRTTSVYENNIQEIRDYMESLMDKADKILQDNGSSWEQLARKIQAANRNKTAPELTDIEVRMYKAVLNELDEAYSIAQQSGRADSDNRQEWYLPQVKEGSVRVPETMEDIYNTGFGYDQSRKNAIELEDLDYGFNPVVDYVVRGRAAEQLRKQTIFENYRQSVPDAPIESIERATEIRYAADANINKLTEDPKADPSKIDTVGAAKQVAEELGLERVQNNAKLARGLNVRDALENAGVLNDGFNQYRRAQAIAGNYETVDEIRAAYNLPVSQNGLNLNYITDDRAAKILNRLDANLEKVTDPAQIDALKSNAIRALAKANVDEMLLRTEFTDPKLSSLVNEEYNRMAIGFNKATSTGDKIGVGLRRIMNSSMRGFNLNSALTELTDVVNAMHIYGRYGWKNLSPRGTMDVLERWGQQNVTARMDNPDKAAEVFDALSRGDKKALDRISSAASTVEEKLALYRYGENYKAALFLKSAEDFWRNADPNLPEAELTKRVLDEFDKNMLPLDHFTRVFKSDNQLVKLLTQYLDWNILNTRQQARNLVGANDSGRYRDMGRGARIANNLATNLLPRVAVGMARGVPIVTTIGVLDPFGFASQDFSGIQEEDKNLLDRFAEVAGVSPLLGLITNAYFNYRQDEETAEDYEGGEMPTDNRGNWIERSARNVEKMFTPYGGQIGSYDQLLRNFGVDFGAPANGRGSQAVEMMQDGYSENREGRVQYLAPENPLEVARAWLMGKGQTQNGREYSGTPDIFSVMAGKASLADLWNSNSSVEAVTGQGDYLRPVSDNDFTIGKDEAGNAMTKNFNDMIKAAETPEERQAILEQARSYNAVLDDFRKENPQAAEAYDQIMSNDDLVSPEYWKEIVGTNADGSINLNIFKMIGDRKKELAKSLGAPYDPMYDLPDDQARALLQLKSAATGDDLALRNILYKSDWYNQYVDARSAYYDKLPEQTDNESRQSTERVKQWNVYDKQLNSLSMLNTPDLQQQFPYNAAYKAAQKEYESKTGKDFYGSEESKQWFSLYGNGKKAEDAALDAAKLEVINQMRVIEGFPPMTPEQYAQATEIADTSGGKSGSGGGGGGQYDFVPEFYNSFEATKLAAPKSKVVDFNPNTSVGRRTNSKKSLGARSGGGDKYSV